MLGFNHRTKIPRSTTSCSQTSLLETNFFPRGHASSTPKEGLGNRSLEGLSSIFRRRYTVALILFASGSIPDPIVDRLRGRHIPYPRGISFHAYAALSHVDRTS